MPLSLHLLMASSCTVERLRDERREGQGTTFIVRLPLHAAPHA